MLYSEPEGELIEARLLKPVESDPCTVLSCDEAWMCGLRRHLCLFRAFLYLQWNAWKIRCHVQSMFQSWNFQTKWSRTVRTRGNGMHIAQEIWSYYKYQTLLKATEFSVQMLRLACFFHFNNIVFLYRNWEMIFFSSRENAQEHIYRSLISHANHLVIKVC